MSGTNFRLISVAILAASLTASCSLTPDYFRPEVPVPQTYTAKSATVEPTLDPDWWRLFRNRTLTRLINDANFANTDIGAAIARVHQARASYRIARSSLFPQIDASGNVALTHTDVKGFPSSTRKTWRAAGALDWDLDIFGGNRAATASALADVAASEFDREAVQLDIQSEVATTYIALLLARERLRISADTITNFNDVLRIAEARFKAGAGSALDVSQQKSALATVRAARSLLEEDVRNAENAIAVLVSDAAGTLKLAGGGLSAMRAPTIKPGQPVALLARRPDVRRAEANLIAANADIGVARAALFPNLSLNVDAAISSDPLTKTISIGSALLAPIFHGGRLKAGVQLSEARMIELVEAYRKTYLVALREVEDALAAVRSARQRVAELSIALDEARNSYRLQRIQYEAGAIDFQTLLDAQRTLFDTDDNLALSRFDRLNAAVALIRALGGGWIEEQAMLLNLIASG